MASNDDFRTFKHNIISNYKTIKSRKEYLSKILKTYNNGESQRLNDDDAEIVKIFYEEFYQPVHRDEKYSSNEISHIESIDYTDENNYRSRCLRFNFIDKKCGRIGIKHLVGSKLNTQTNFKILLGKAINPQIQEFKSSQINMDDASKYDVDHLKTFESLVQGFIEENRELKDFNAKRLPDETKKKWIDCHKKHATLQLIKKEDHREKTKNDRKNNWGKVIKSNTNTSDDLVEKMKASSIVADSFDIMDADKQQSSILPDYETENIIQNVSIIEDENVFEDF